MSVFLIKIKCFFINLQNKVRGKQHSVALQNDGLYKITDRQQSIYIARLNRHNRYKKSIEVGVNLLAEEYSLDALSFENDSVLIECGANVGELAIWAKARSLAYIGFEPEAKEFECVKLNAPPTSKVYRNALWHQKEALTIYSLPGSGDSSVFDISEAEGCFEIEAVRLDEEVNLSSYAGTRILKVEAEGAEPEVLQGAIGLLDQIDYVTVDCGPERGENQDYTFVDINDILTCHGFQLIQAKFKRVTMLYGNTKRMPNS